MPATTAKAPGKIILFGEHAVVYERPAIAVPVRQVSVRVVVSPRVYGQPGEILIKAPLVKLESTLDSLSPSHPLATTLDLVFKHLGVTRPPAMDIMITGNIPVAAGLGSGAAVSVATIRAVSAFLGHRLEDAEVNSLAYQVEKIYHGTPSGIDNTVITYNMPVYFVKHQPIETFKPAVPFTILIGDTGIPSPTKTTVGIVRSRWEADPGYYENLFDWVAMHVKEARRNILEGKLQSLGNLMNANQELLHVMGVSSPELQNLIWAARRAGALGAKLSGGGGGGNMIALVTPETAEQVEKAVLQAGAVRTILTTIS